MPDRTKKVDLREKKPRVQCLSTRTYAKPLVYILPIFTVFIIYKIGFTSTMFVYLYYHYLFTFLNLEKIYLVYRTEKKGECAYRLKIIPRSNLDKWIGR